MNTFSKKDIAVREEKDEIEIDLGQLFAVIMGRLWLILLIGFTVAVIAFFATKIFVTPIYQSSTKIYVLNKQSDTTNLTASDVQLSTLLTKDYQQLITSRAVLEQVIKEENLDMTYAQISSQVVVNTPADTRIVEIVVSNPDPKIAQDIANRVRTVASDHIQSVMDTQAVNTVDEANLASQPSRPSAVKNAMIGGLLGLFLAAGVVILLFILNDRIKSVEDIEQHLGLGTLGSIPLATEDKKQAGRSRAHRQSTRRGQPVKRTQMAKRGQPIEKGGR